METLHEDGDPDGDEEGESEDLEGGVFLDEISDGSRESQDQDEGDDDGGNDDLDLVG